MQLATSDGKAGRDVEELCWSKIRANTQSGKRLLMELWGMNQDARGLPYG